MLHCKESTHEMTVCKQIQKQFPLNSNFQLKARLISSTSTVIIRKFIQRLSMNIFIQKLQMCAHTILLSISLNIQQLLSSKSLKKSSKTISKFNRNTYLLSQSQVRDKLLIFKTLILKTLIQMNCFMLKFQMREFLFHFKNKKTKRFK